MHSNWQRVALQSLPALLLGVLAFTLVMVATDPPGPGLDPDALSYMGAAQSLVQHGSYRIPAAPWNATDTTAALAHFPPGFSTVLAIPIAAGMEPTQAARVVEATAAFLTTTLIVLLVASATDIITGALLAIGLMTMTAMHEVHISVLSEPLFLACMMLVLTAMVRWPGRPLRAGIPAAAAIMTRYAGAALVGAVGLWMLLQRGTWRERIRRAVVAVAPGVLLQLAWVIRTRGAGDADDIRKFAIYGDLARTLDQGRLTIMGWLAPDPTLLHDISHRGWVTLALGAALISLVYMGYSWLRWMENQKHALRLALGDASKVYRAAEEDTRTPVSAWRARVRRRLIDRVEDALLLLRACALLLACYFGLLTASRVFADPLIPLDERIMAPALVLAMIVIAITVSTWWRHTRRMIARVSVSLGIALWLLASAGATRLEARYALTWGSDFAGHQWRTSELLAWARTNAAHNPLYTNWPAAVYFYLHRTSYELPRHADPQTLQAFGDTVRARNGRVLLFAPHNVEYIPNDSLFSVPGLTRMLELRDGAVLASSAEQDRHH